MILDKTQIKAVESFIVKNDIDFVDIKFELLDHMVCDIEATIEADNISFEDAFNRTVDKWKPYFAESHSFWMGLAYIKPKIVIDKCGALMKKTTLYSLLTALIVASGVWFLSITISFNLEIIFSNLYKVRWVLFAVSLAILIFHCWNILSKKVKTVFGYCYVRQFSFLPLFILLVTPPKYNSLESQFLPLVFLVMYAAYYYFAFKIYLEHEKYVKRSIQFNER